MNFTAGWRATPGSQVYQGLHIQAYGGKLGGYVQLDGQRFDIRAGIHTLDGFSAHSGTRQEHRGGHSLKHGAGPRRQTVARSWPGAA